MITRKPIINFPYSCLSSIKIQKFALLHDIKDDAVTHDKSNNINVNNEKPFLWSSCASYVCKIDSKSIVKKLDINALVKEHYQPHNPLVCSTFINNGPCEIKQYNVETKASKIQSKIPIFRNNESIYSLRTSLKNAYNGEEDKINFKKVKKMPASEKNDLPNSDQLDEMMCYFAEQASYIFKSQGWSYRNCSYKIIFENNLIGTKTDSLNAYILQINIMKNLTRLLLINPELTILRMTKNLVDGSIQVRWQVDGVPRYLKPFSLFGLIDEKRFIRYTDGFSIFYVKSDGLYHKHVLMNMTPLRNERRQSLMSQILANLGFYGAIDTGFPKQPAIPTFHKD